MFRDPWFSIVEVTEGNRRSMADIVADVCRDHGLTLPVLRGARRSVSVCNARKDAIRRIRLERPDISSTVVGRFMHREPSVIRHFWRQEAA